MADMDIGGIEVPAGDVLMLLVAAAHRDPAEFDCPDVFDPDRGALRDLGSVAGCITAWGRRWRGWKPVWPSRC